MALPFTLKSILRQKKNYENLNIFTMQKFNLQKEILKETKILKKKKKTLKENKILQDIITLQH
jgi:hypothetical protein